MTLSGAGVRLVIEGMCKDLKLAKGPVVEANGNVKQKANLEEKIGGLAEKGYITAKQSVSLHEIRSLGNDAAHDLDQPPTETLSTAIDIVEHLLEQIYNQPYKTSLLEGRKKQNESKLGKSKVE